MKGAANIATAIHESQGLMGKLQADERGFEKLSKLLREHAGINMQLNPKNLTLMASRLISVLKAHELGSYKDYIELLSQGSPAHLSEFVSSLTTNTTQFFREPVHFDALKLRLAEIIENKKRTHNHEIRIWCSAASTGQEVYTIMMVVLAQMEALPNWDIRFLATDIDPEVIARASQGVYQETEMNGVPEIARQQYFDVLPGKMGKRYQVKAEIREKIRFATFNLLTPSYPFQHPFDIVFCRNVLIYFDRPTAEAVINKLGTSLGTGGYLFLGHSETGMMKCRELKNVSSAAYQKIGK